MKKIVLEMTLQEKLESKYYERNDVVLKTRDKAREEVESYFYKNTKVTSSKDLEILKNQFEDEIKLVMSNNRKEYNIEENNKLIEFKKDLEEDFGFENHPKKDILYNIAWEDGHSNGFYEVYLEYEKLSELIK